MNNDNKFKIISLVFAFTLWIFVIGTENPRVERTYLGIPVNIRSMETIYEDGNTVIGNRDISVDVTLQGSLNSFINVSSTDIRAEVDLKDYNPNRDEMLIDFTTPEGTTILEASIYSVPLKVENVVTKEVRVEVENTGTPDDNVVVDKIVIIPETIVITGASSLVELVDRAVALVDVTSIGENTTRNLPISLKTTGGEDIDGIDMSQSFVNASFQTSQIIRVPINLITENDYPEGVEEISRELSQSEVSLLVDSSLANQIQQIGTMPLDLSKIKESGTYDLSLGLPEGVRTHNPDFELSINIELDKLVEKTLTIGVGDLELRNLPGELKAELNGNTEEIKVDLVGMEKTLESIEEEDLSLFVDLQNYSQGSHQLNVQVDNIEGVNFATINPKNIGLTLQSNQTQQSPPNTNATDN